MASNPNRQRPAGGLGQPTPLATKAAPTMARGVAVPGDEHPLAARAVAVAILPNEHALVPPAANIQYPAAAAPAAPPPRSPIVAKVVPATPTGKVRVTPASVSPARTLDTLADAFLAEESYRTSQLGLSPMLRPTPLPPGDGIGRLRTLVERRAWGDVLKLSANILNSREDPHSDVYISLLILPANAPQADISTVTMQIRLETVEIMTLQCHAWLKLRRYSDLSAEIERWNFLTQNQSNAQSPDWLPWTLHILAGQARQYTGDFNQAADILSELKERIPKEDHVALVAVNNALANLYLRRGEWRLALGCLDQVLDLIPEATESEVRMKHFNTTSDTLALVSLLSSAYKCEVLSRQGRVLLQLGALPQVSEIFKYARKEWTATESNLSPDLANHIAVKLTSCQMEVNEAVFYFAQSNNEHAVESFKKALKILRKQRILSPKYNPDVWMGLLVWSFDVSNTLYSECINNMALCSLYSCRMKEAVNLLEDLVRADPTAFLTERVAFNLCTLYELGADSAVSARRKRILQLIAKRFFLHDIGPESFRVQ